MKKIVMFFTVVFWAVSFNGVHAAEEPQVETTTGIIRGVSTEYGAMYLGIPYAEPPIGELRWQPPQPIELPEVYNAAEFGCSCPQPESTLGLSGIPSANEDCLFLNVYVPEKNIRLFRKKPVMVWIHGGSNMFGAGHAYDPTRLVERGVIVVTMNYRLGALGFLAHPALSAASADGVSGNYGIMDQRLALEWVQDNIAAFDGDPKNVTLFGQSAGAVSILVHMASPGSENLFHRAIIQSPGENTLKQPALEDWEMIGSTVAENMGCSDQSMDCLRNLSVETILQNQRPGSTTGYLPNVDGKILPQTTMAALLSGDFHRMPVILGTTHDEMSLFAAVYAPLLPDDYLEMMAFMGLSPENVPAVAEEYPLENYNSAVEGLIAISTDALYAVNARMALMLLSFRVKAFGYEFNDPNAPHDNLPEMSFPYGAYHASDLPYLMDMDAGQWSEMDDDQKALAETMIGYWAGFAAFGTPNWSSGPFWPQYDLLFQLMNTLAPPSPKITRNYGKDHHCRFWMSLFL